MSASVARSKTAADPGGTSSGGARRRTAAARSKDAHANGAGSNGGQSNGTSRRLVIVESPAKARKIASYLGGLRRRVLRGHIRDLPHGAADVPAKYKGERGPGSASTSTTTSSRSTSSRPDKKSKVTKLKALLKDADELYLATDEDREGEAIAWHLLESSSPRSRCTGWSSTRSPSRPSARPSPNPRDLNQDLVDAQETRRILDRLYGYEVSPVLWKKVMPRPVRRAACSRWRPAGRRARARADGVPRPPSYWDLDATFDAGEGERAADVPGQAGRRRRPAGSPAAATSAPTGELKRSRRRCTSTRRAPRRLAAALPDAASRRPLGRVQALHAASPYAPFRTTTLQQEASRKLGSPPSAPCGRAAALRERLHHLHAYRLHDAVGDGDHGGPAQAARALRRASTSRDAAAVHLQGQERPGGARGDPARRRDASAPRQMAGALTATSSGSTS